MKCPRCNYAWDVREGACPQCNLYLPVSRMSDPARAPISSSGSSVNKPILSIPTNDSSARPDDLPVQYQFPMTPPPPNFSRTSVEAETLQPGVLLHRNRYRLQKQLRRQEWPLKFVETIWFAFDTGTAKSPVIIHELCMPENASKEVLDVPFTATKVLTSIGRNAHIQPLLDVFISKERHFFVFKVVDGLSLPMLMANYGGKLSEKAVIACCLQITELLDICSKQSPPLIHGMIKPESIVRSFSDSQYVLTNFSVALAGGLMQLIADRDEGKSSLSSSRLFMSGKIDVSTDIYALLATAYYAATGEWVSDTGMSANFASHIAPNLHFSPAFRALLLQGLQPLPQRHYQSPSELYLDLLSLIGSPMPAVHPVKPEPIRARSQRLSADKEPGSSMPMPDELPSLGEGHDLRNAVLWFAIMLFCLVILVLF